MPSTFEDLQNFLEQSSGLLLQREKQYLVEDRLKPVLAQAGLSGLPELVARMQVDRALAKQVTDAMTVNETFFFRDRAPFEGFRSVILPGLVAARARARKIRLWSAACSTGQEPYSLAIILDEEARKLAGWSVDIVASDISDSVLNRAREGLYSHFEAQRGLPISHLARYFIRQKDRWAINHNIKARVDFRQQNLTGDFSRLGVFDVIFCRNVLIYFSPDRKRDVLARLARSLAPDGYLVLGAAESVFGYSSEFEPHPENRAVLLRRALGAPRPEAPVPGRRAEPA